MTFSVYRWGWFTTAMSRAIWGWTGSEAAQGGFTPRAAIAEAVFKAAPVEGGGVSVRGNGRAGTVRRSSFAALMHKPVSPASRVGRQDMEPTPSKDAAGRPKRVHAGARAVKTGRQMKKAATAKAVNKTKKP